MAQSDELYKVGCADVDCSFLEQAYANRSVQHYFSNLAERSCYAKPRIVHVLSRRIMLSGNPVFAFMVRTGGDCDFDD